jgi:hypothetical protein
MPQDLEHDWALLQRLIAGDLVVDGAARELERHRAHFEAAHAQVTFEHGFVRNAYYRNPDGSGCVNVLNAEHLARLLYWFSRNMRLGGAPVELLDQLFLALRSRCAIELFYDHDLPPFLLTFHPAATVLGRADYARFLVVSQGCTIGNNHGRYPSFDEGVVLRPGSMVLGGCRIGANVQIGAGAIVVDTDIPPNSTVTGQGRDGLTIRPNSLDVIDTMFLRDRLTEAKLLPADGRRGQADSS